MMTSKKPCFYHEINSKKDGNKIGLLCSSPILWETGKNCDLLFGVLLHDRLKFKRYTISTYNDNLFSYKHQWTIIVLVKHEHLLNVILLILRLKRKVTLVICDDTHSPSVKWYSISIRKRHGQGNGNYLIYFFQNDCS